MALKIYKRSDNNNEGTSTVNHNIRKVIPELTKENIKEVCERNVFVGIDFGTSITVVSCCYWDEKSEQLKIEELELDELTTTNPPTKTHLIPTIIYVDEEEEKFIIGLLRRDIITK